MNKNTYIGSELEIFRHATNWKSYYRRKIIPYINGLVLEVGAGIGATTKVLHLTGRKEHWICLEPDETLADVIRVNVKDNKLPPTCEVLVGTTSELSLERQFDTVIYIDVLEHIREDLEELKRASALLKPNGHLIVLSPAFPFLYSPFDKSIGHFRRYTKSHLAAIAPKELHLKRLFYLDCVGFLLSAGNRLLLKKAMPNYNQVRFWDLFAIPCSTILDHVFTGFVGRSVVGIWQK